MLSINEFRAYVISCNVCTKALLIGLGTIELGHIDQYLGGELLVAPWYYFVGGGAV